MAPLVRTQAREAYIREFNVAQRITCVQVNMLTKLWYTAQVLQPPQCVPTAHHIGHYVVYMAVRHFSSANINTAEGKRGRRLRSD